MKVKNYRTFWILLALVVCSIPALNYWLFSLLKNSFPKFKGKNNILGSPFAFPDVWQTVSWNSTMLFLIPGILIITLTTNEFTYRTHRQNVIDGWSRGQFIGVKLFEIFLLALLTTLVVFLTTLAFGYIGNQVPAGISVWQSSRFILFYLIHTLTYSMIAFLLAVLIRRAGLAIGAFLIYKIVEKVIVGATLIAHLQTNAADYLPEQVSEQLIPFPYIKSIPLQDMTKWEHQIPAFILVALFYLVVYCLVTSRRFLKSDL
jgi:hypothetical protein